MKPQHRSSTAASGAELDPALASFVAATVRAKRMAAALYLGLRERAPGPTGALAITRIVEDEESHAAALAELLGAPRQSNEVMSAPPAGCSPYGESWASGLMAAFALDQAATAALIALTAASEPQLSTLARRIVGEEEQHQTFALGAFRALADADPALGVPLAKEMIRDRDWIKEIYPRRAHLIALAEAGHVAEEAARRHDSFLPSLGDRIQDALGVLGEL